MSTLPPQLTEASFRRYELTILAAVNHFPNTLIIRSADMSVSPTTYAARLRDAITSLYNNRWQSTIPSEVFRRIRGLLTVAHRGDEVWIGSAAKLREKVVEKPVIFTSTDEIPITPTTWEEKKLLCFLSASQALSKRLKIFNLSSTEQEHLLKMFDVGFKEVEDGSVILL